MNADTKTAGKALARLKRVTDAARRVTDTEPSWRPPWGSGRRACFYCDGPKDHRPPFRLQHREDCSFKALVDALSEPQS